jgi:sugar diacid utilization regulator
VIRGRSTRSPRRSGAGLPAVARAAAKVLDASVALIDRSSAVLAVAGASSDQEKKLIAGGEEISRVELRVADSAVGELRYRSRSDPNPAIARMVTTLLALELERARSPEWESEEVAGAFVGAVLAREVTDRGDIVARAAEMGADLDHGAGVLIVRAAPRAAQTGEWRARVLTLTLRALRSLASGALATAEEGEAAEVAAIVPAEDDERLGRAAVGLSRELADGLPGFHLTIGHSRRAADPVDLYRAGNEARLAVNVGEAEGRALLAFEDTGAYRLLLPAISEDPRELERFYAETVAPLAAYDEQYETELVATVEAYLDNDGNVAATAKQLFTHRHTVRYRLERVKELCGHDVSATEGREKLGLGLKAMRVLGIASPRGPALEPGAEAGQVKAPRTGEQ